MIKELIVLAATAGLAIPYTPYDPGKYRNVTVVGLDTTKVGDATMVAVKFTGEITEETANILREAIEDTFARSQLVAYLELWSHGGSGWGGNRLGLLLRQYPTLPILVTSECSSACAMAVLTANPRRLVLGPYGKIGVHQSHFPDTGMPADRSTQSNAEKLREAGIPVTVVRGLTRTPPDKVYWLTESELAQIGVRGRYVIK